MSGEWFAHEHLFALFERKTDRRPGVAEITARGFGVSEVDPAHRPRPLIKVESGVLQLLSDMEAKPWL